MRSFRHWTPRYIWNRTALALHERRNPTAPWLTASMIELLDTWLLPSDAGLEFGSGRSTKWFAQRVGQLVIVEHNRQWYGRVKLNLETSSLAVDYRLHEDGSAEESSSSYVEVARSMPEKSLDFCLVDGVSRDHCALAVLDKLKTGGVLIIDNVNWFIPREHAGIAPNSRRKEDSCASLVWTEVHAEISAWRGIWTSNGVWDTALWVKP